MNSYFAKFNYSLANEDTAVERKESQPYRSILSITGSGSRIIPLLRPDVERLTAIDVSNDQLTFLKLKRSLVTQLPDDTYLKFLGYRKASRTERLSILHRLKLSDEETRLAKWEESLDEGLIYQGAWEKKLRARGRWIRRLLGLDFTPLFEAKTLEEQRHVFTKIWPRRRLAIFLKLFASRRAINRAVYGGGMPAETDESLSKFLIENFEHHFQNKPARSSFFHQLLFLDSVKYEEGFPIETQPQALLALRECGNNIEFVHGDFASELMKDRHDYFSLSDVLSYLPADRIRDLEKILANSKSLRALTARTFQHHPEIAAPPGWKKTHLSPESDVTRLYRIQAFVSSKGNS